MKKSKKKTSKRKAKPRRGSHLPDQVRKWLETSIRKLRERNPSEQGYGSIPVIENGVPNVIVFKTAAEAKRVLTDILNNKIKLPGM